MSLLHRIFGKKAFTLIELLVVIAIISILAAILIPTISKALLRGAATKAMANGKSIYTSVFAKSLDDMVLVSTDASFPSSVSGDSNYFADSTEYFKYLVTNNILNVSFDYFAEKQVPPAKSTEATDFDAENNSWCVVADFNDSTPDGTPFLFTRNCSIQTTAETQTGFRDNAMDPEVNPFGNDALVTVFKGGSAYTMLDEQINYENFNPSGVTNEVLRPGAGY